MISFQRGVRAVPSAADVYEAAAAAAAAAAVPRANVCLIAHIYTGNLQYQCWTHAKTAVPCKAYSFGACVL